ncbi:MAG: protein translocase subunit SecDF, partial [Flavobacterium sp.]|nr:protein translocase subunit SecDF [Flavobacterium sp.]
MQNRGLIKFFAILFALVSIYQLTFTFVADNVESKAKAFANGDSEKENAYLDSIGKQDVFLGMFTYNEVKEKKINKGLDLEGGINVILQISVKDVLKGLANNSKDAVFNKSLEDATANLKGNQTYIDAFFIAFNENSQGKTKLASPEIFANKNMQGVDGINFKMTNSEAEKVIRKKVDESVNSAFLVLRKRIDKFGVTQPNIQKLGESGRILVELPGAKDVDRIKKLLSSTAQLEFWETYKLEEMAPFLGAANSALQKTEVAKKQTAPAVKDTLAALLTDADSTATEQGNNPLFDKIIGQGGGPVLASFSPKDTADINRYLKRQDIINLLQGEQRYAKFVWGKPETLKDNKGAEIEALQLYALKGNRNNVAPMSGGVITEARDEFDAMGKP